MNYHFIIGLIAALLLLNNTLFGLIPMPPIVNLIIVGIAAFTLFLGGSRGGFFGKLCIWASIVLALYFIIGVLSFFGIPVPFLGSLYRYYRYFAIGGAALLLTASFLS
ncbi:hypothetical protein HYU14_03335 [Candidatus Woesearchaeota archaeon]|nr:hypothetical protein [Candidatus Woesearchaeota archaeon]